MELAIGIIIGIFIGYILFHHRPVGNLRVDHSDMTSAPYLFLELGVGIETIMRKKYVTLKVRVEDFLPHQ